MINRWQHTKKWVDIETGEVLTENKVKREYIIIRKNKKITYEKERNKYGADETIGNIEWTNECTRTGKQIGMW